MIGLDPSKYRDVVLSALDIDEFEKENLVWLAVRQMIEEKIFRLHNISIDPSTEDNKVLDCIRRIAGMEEVLSAPTILRSNLHPAVQPNEGGAKRSAEEQSRLRKDIQELGERFNA